MLGKVDLDDRKRNSLFAKLTAFEADVDRIRTPFDNAMLATIEVLALAKEAGGALEPLTKSVEKINVLMGRSKSGSPSSNSCGVPATRSGLSLRESRSKVVKVAT